MKRSGLDGMAREARDELLSHIIPFWLGLRDEERGGFYGGLSYDLELGRDAPKGCILNSRITWFFASTYKMFSQGSLAKEDLEGLGYGVSDLRDAAEHGFRFMKEHCLDSERGGIYWSAGADGAPLDTTKHTYNQAFAIYALSAYYDAMGDAEALGLAAELFTVIEKKCRDDGGYLEAFTRDFKPASNEKLSENGVLAERTMNTLLHVQEAYTELCRVLGVAKARGDEGAERRILESGGGSIAGLREKVLGRLLWIMDLFVEKVYNPRLRRQEVFFDAEYRPLIDLHSYGHDIETSWLMDRCLSVVGDPAYVEKIAPITRDLAEQVYRVAFDGSSLANECERGVVSERRIWWVQAEAVVGFLNAWQKSPDREEYLNAALAQWRFIRDHVADRRPGSEWFWEVRKDGSPVEGRPIVEPWKCPYHNGRMAMEIMRRSAEMGADGKEGTWLD